MEQLIQQLEQKITRLFSGEGSGHDLYHLKRVLNLALNIQAKEGGDKVIISVAAFLHDVHRIMSNESGKYVTPKESLPKIKQILAEVDLTPEQKEKILHCIEFHEEYNFSPTGKTVDDLETLIVQDADNLDSMGAIGTGRTFSYGGSHNIPLWRQEIPFDRKTYSEETDDPSTLHHFHSKLLKLGQNMNTKTAKKLAQGRHDFMENFVKEFFSEWNGEK